MVVVHDTPGTKAASSPIIMGHIAGPYGIKGWVRVVSYTEPLENLLDYRPWQLRQDKVWQSVDVVEARRHGKGLVVRLPDCRDRDMAARYSGTEIGIFREQLPVTDDDEYYWDDLVGLHVVTLDGKELGIVDHLIETGSNDVLVIKGEREYLVPFIQGKVINAVDLAGRQIRVDWDPDF
jgi:16S rRNA processing protein RimM